MKRVFSAIAVIAIVCSALAFAPAKKGGQYCASLTQNFGCAPVPGKTELSNSIPGSQTYFKYSAWNGTAGDCQSDRCPTQTILYIEP